MEIISISTHPAPASSTSSHSDITTLKTLQTDANSLSNKHTVSSLQQTIKDLKIQRQELDITITVLSNQLHQLITTPSKSLKHNQTDGHYQWHWKEIYILHSIWGSKKTFVEVKYTFARSDFQTQLPIFKGGSAKEFPRFLNELSYSKTKLD